MNDAFFAGHTFVPGEQDSYKFLMWGTHSMPTDGRGGMMFSSTFAEPAEGAFLCQLEAGWLLVCGAGKYNGFRHTFFDDSPQSSENARSLQALGVTVLTIDEGNKRCREGGVALYSVTGEEKARAAAVARYEAWRAECEAQKSKTPRRKR